MMQGAGSAGGSGKGNLPIFLPQPGQQFPYAWFQRHTVPIQPFHHADTLLLGECSIINMWKALFHIPLRIRRITAPNGWQRCRQFLQAHLRCDLMPNRFSQALGIK